MKIAVFFALLLSIPSTLLGQQAGSADAYRMTVEMQRQNNLEQIDWQNSKKLSLFEIPKDTPRPERSTSLILDRLETGVIGKLSYWKAKVLSVVDENNVILVFDSGQRVWLEGYPTKNLIDAQPVRILDYVEVMGTKNYQTVGGANSNIRHLRMLPKEDTLKHTAEEAKKADEIKKYGYRKWQPKNPKMADVLGKMAGRAVGKFIEYRNSKLTIEDREGKQYTFPVNVLSDEDKDFVISLWKERQAEAAAK